MKIELLVDHPNTTEQIAQWYFHERGRYIEGNTLDRMRERLQEKMNRDRVPLVVVALEGDRLAGSAELKFREMDIFSNYEHWLGSVFVAPQSRGNGVASALAQEVARRAQQLGVRKLYLQTEQLDGGLYARLGWYPLQQVNHRGLERLIMCRDL